MSRKHKPPSKDIFYRSDKLFWHNLDKERKKKESKQKESEIKKVKIEQENISAYKLITAHRVWKNIPGKRKCITCFRPMGDYEINLGIKELDKLCLEYVGECYTCVSIKYAKEYINEVFCRPVFKANDKTWTQLPNTFVREGRKGCITGKIFCSHKTCHMTFSIIPYLERQTNIKKVLTEHLKTIDNRGYLVRKGNNTADIKINKNIYPISYDNIYDLYKILKEMTLIDEKLVEYE